MNDYLDQHPDILSSEEDNLVSGDSSSEDDDGPTNPPPPVSQNFFAPPFYGRPPTPLPPSPSLTSLLRPSRPTTPDASDDDVSRAVADDSSLEPVPRASPKVPTYEYYGFVLYLFSSLTFLIYLLWAYLPSPFLHALGIFYYPNRWWALAIPAFLVMLIVYVYVALACYNTEYLTLPLGSLETVVDEAAKVACVDSRGRLRSTKGHHDGGGGGAKVSEARALEIEWRGVWNRGTDAVMDVPLAGVNEVLYGYGEDDDDEF